MTNKATCSGCGAHLSAIYRGEPCPNGCDNPPTPSIVAFITARLDADLTTFRQDGYGVEEAERMATALRRVVEAEIENRIAFDGELCACDADEVRAGECERWTPERSELLHALASAWNTHPEYQPEWKPVE